MVGLSLVTTITATVIVPPGPVAADQVANLKAQASQIAQDLVLEQLQIGTDEQQHDVDVVRIGCERAQRGNEAERESDSDDDEAAHEHLQPSLKMSPLNGRG